MLVVVLKSEYIAYKGAAILKQLDEEGSISVHAAAIIEKISDGKVTILQTKEEFPIRTVGGTAIGSLIGLLGGPLGVLVGAATGVVLGDVGDLYRSGVNRDFVDDVSSKLTPGKYALVADISEENLTSLDTKMAELDGQVFRIRKRIVEIEQIKGDIAATNAEIAQLNKEMKNAGREQKANFQAKIEKLKEKRQKEIEHAKLRLKQREKERDIKVLALKEKAANARGKTKADIEARVTQINNDFQKTLRKWKDLEAERLEKRADRLRDKARQLKS